MRRVRSQFLQSAFGRLSSGVRDRGHARRLVAVGLGVVAASTANVAVAAESYVPGGIFSGPGADPGQLTDPERAVVEQATGNLFVADRGNGRVQVFAPDGSFLTEFGSSELEAPFGIALDQSGGQTKVYVSDPGTDQIVRYDSDEAPTPTFTVDGGFASPARGGGAGRVGSFASPLAVDATSGELLVGDTGKDIVQRFSATGSYVADYDGASSPGGAFTGLLDLAADSQGRYYVVDSNSFITGQPDGTAGPGTSRVDRFGPDGAHQLALAGLNRPANVAVDLATDDVVVSADQDAVNSDQAPSLHVFDPSGTELHSFRQGGSATWNTVHGLAIASPDKTIWSVNDSGYFGGSPYGQEQILRFDLTQAPTVTVDPVTNVGSSSADFAGTVNPEGQDTTARFEISSDGGSSWTALPDIDPAPGNGTTPVPVTYSATALQPATTYQVRLNATTAAGASANSTPESFTTDPADAATVVLGTPDVTTQRAVIEGTVNPNGSETTYRFEHSTDGGATWLVAPPTDETTGTSPAGGGTSPVDVALTLPWPTPNATYDVRLIATNLAGDVTETTQFTTASVEPAAETWGTTERSATTAILKGRVNPMNAPTTYWFEWGTSAGDYSNSFPVSEDADAGSSYKLGEVRQELTGLRPDTTYYYRVVADNAFGDPVAGVERTVTTRPATEPACANERVRQQQRSEHLADCRAYELINAPDTNMNHVAGGTHAEDGEKVLYDVGGGAPGSDNGSIFNTFLATRTSSGWEQRALLPNDPDVSIYSVDAATRDFTKFYLTTNALFTDPHKITKGLLADDQGNATEVFDYGSQSSFGNVTTSVDLTRRYAGTARRVVPEHPPFTTQLYAIDTMPAEIVGLMPDGSIPDCGVRSFGIGNDGIPEEHQVSDDGRFIFFTSSGNDCSGPEELYRRDRNSGTTDWISEPAPGEDARGAYWVQASPEGNRVLLVTPSVLTAFDTNESRDVYLYEDGDEPDCLTCAFPNLDPAPVASDSSQVIPRAGVVASQDFTRIYLTSRRQMSAAQGATEGRDNIYLLEGGQLRFVASLTQFADPVLAMNGTRGQLTEDGEHLTFVGSQAACVGVTCAQLHRYAADTGEVTCITCSRTDDPETQWHGDGGDHMSQDGSHVVFTSVLPFVPRDRDNDTDVYEWHDGRFSLVSGGSVNTERVGGLVGSFGITSSGNAIFFIDLKSLVPGMPYEGDGHKNFYVARAGGGFLYEPPPDGGCEDDCQGPPSGAPDEDEVGSGTRSGPGNFRQPAPDCSALAQRMSQVKRQLKRSEGKAKKKLRRKLRTVNRRHDACRADCWALAQRMSQVARQLKRSKGKAKEKLRATLRTVRRQHDACRAG